MTTLAEIAYTILNTISGGKSEDAPKVSIEQIAHLVLTHRSMLIRRDLGESGRRTLEYEQALTVPLELVIRTGEIIPELPQKGVLESVRALPKPLRLKERSGITRITTPDGSGSIPLVDEAYAFAAAHNPFTSTMRRAFLDISGKLVIVGDPTADALTVEPPEDEEAEPEETSLATQVTVSGIWDDPREVYTWETGEPFVTHLTEFYLPGDLEQRIIQSILSKEIAILGTVAQDLTQDNLPGTDLPASVLRKPQ